MCRNYPALIYIVCIHVYACKLMTVALSKVLPYMCVHTVMKLILISLISMLSHSQTHEN